jgi:hypothetical protein
MATCPAGHESAAEDFCDVCGMRMAATASAASHSGFAAGPSASAAGVTVSDDAAGEHCPSCGTDRAGKFCEVCGFDFSAGTAVAGSAVAAATAGAAGPRPTAAMGETSEPAAATGPVWMAVVNADRDYFETVIAAGGPDAASIQFPAYCPERRFRLAGREMRIGRRSSSRGLEPEIDLTGPPTDPGVSHLHVVLTAGPDGGWSVMDPGSSNGTQVNGSDIAVGVPVPLHDGDRIALGGWTVVRIQVT